MNHKSIYFPFFIGCWLITLWSCQEQNVLNKNEQYSKNNELGQIYLAKLQLDSAFYYFTEAKNNCTDTKGEQWAYTIYQIANIQQINGDYAGCEETLTEAIANYTGQTYWPYLYNMLAINYEKQDEFQLAIENYNNAQNATIDTVQKLLFQNNKALVHLEQKKYTKAIQLLNPLLENEGVKNNTLEYARMLDNLGYANYKNNPNTGFEDMYKAWQLRDSLADDMGLIASNMHLSEYYHQKEVALAQKHALNAYLAAVKMNSPDDKLEALKWLTTHSNESDAKKYLEEYFERNEQINRERNTAKNQFAKIKYDAGFAKQEAIKYKNQKVFLLILIGLIILVAFLLYKLYQTKNKRKLQQSTYLTETRISKRIHDELANDVFNTMTYAQTQNLENPNNKELLVDNLENIYKRTRDISKENSDIRTNEHFESDLVQMIESYTDTTRSVIRKVNQEINWKKITAEKKIALFRVVQELLINTTKHSQATLVIIDITEKNNTLVITFTDNGIGLKNTQNHKSGLQNAENRIQAIKGTLTFDTSLQKGCKAILMIPI
ncbi:tetratricopeptide repeat-containing sensor histidine kinase [Flavobacterium orientale]|uniref:tetratricopeptide repeat-containing sensor histidine kinase n=1 Tax=Flavobacterium orientale TaxID=1756020 RepID=UPI00166D121A|nr:ATP-binding protein [Flavobacterium orientale]